MQLISALFMLWAIGRLYKSIRSQREVRGLFDQKMVIIHIITFAAYLISVLIYYVFDELYVSN
mgnify:CR=1 FL=1